MAEESIFISVKTSDGAYEELVKLNLGMKDLREEQKKLDEQRASGKLEMQDYITATAKNRKAQDDQRKAILSLNQTVKELNTTQTSSLGSINAMRASLSGLTKQYNALSKAERDSASGVEMKNKMKSTSDELKLLEGQVGNYTRNVGDYFGKTTEALSGFFPEIGQAKDAFAQLTKIKELFGLATKASTVATTAEAAAATGGAVANTALGGGAIIAASGFDVLKLSLLSNPITLVAVALVGLITYLTQFDGAMDGLMQAWAGIKAAGGPIIDVFGNLGKMVFTLGEIYLKPLFVAFEAISALLSGDFSGALNAVTEGFDEFLGLFGQLSTQADEFTTSANGMVGAMVNAAGAAMQLEKDTQDLEDAQGSLTMELIKSKRETELLDKAAQDKHRSDKDRLADMEKSNAIKMSMAVKEAAMKQKDNEIEMRNLLKSAGYRAADWQSGKKFSAAQIDAIQKHMDMLAREGKLKGDLNEYNKKLAGLATSQLEVETAAQNQTLENNLSMAKVRNSIDSDREAKQKANHEAFMKRQEAQQKAITDAATAQTELIGWQIKASKTDEERQGYVMKAIEDRRKKDLLAAKDNKVKMQAINDAYDNEREESTKAFDDKMFAAKETANKKEEDAAKKVLDDKTKAIEKSYDDLEQGRKTEMLLIDESLAQGYTTELDANALKLEQEGIYLQALLDLRIANGDSTIEARQNIADREIAIAKSKADTTKKIQEAELQTAKNILNIMSGVIDLALGNSSEAANFKKVAALGAIAIDTAIAIAGIVRIASTTSPDPITYGVQLTAGIASVLTNVGNAIGIISSITAPEAPKMAKARMGGLIGGNLHSNGGTLIEAERGEAILNRGAVAMFGPQLSQMNIAGGGQGFGASVDATRTQAQAGLDQEYAMLNAVKQMPAPVVNTRDIARTNRAASRVVSNARI